MSFIIRRLALAVLAVALVACDQAPTTPTAPAASPAASISAAADQGAERNVVENLFDMTGLVIDFPCGTEHLTEEVELRGQIRVRTAFLDDGAGGFRVVVHSWPIGLGGTGLTTGADYKIITSERLNSSFSGGSMQSMGFYRNETIVSAPEIGLHGYYIWTGQWVVDGNGEFVVERPAVRGECRG